MSHAPDAGSSAPVTAGAEDPPRSRVRTVLLGLGIGTGVGVVGIVVAFSIVAIPVFFIASTEPGSGLDRDLVRTGLFQVAVPFGAVAGTLAGVIVGIWYGRGGRLPKDRTPIEY